MLYEVITEYLGSDDEANECFTIPEDYTVTTNSNATGVLSGPVSNPEDTVHITGVNGVEGNWTTDAILAGPSGDYDATCVTSPLVSSGAFPVDA